MHLGIYIRRSFMCARIFISFFPFTSKSLNKSRKHIQRKVAIHINRLKQNQTWPYQRLPIKIKIKVEMFFFIIQTLIIIPSLSDQNWSCHSPITLFSFSFTIYISTHTFFVFIILTSNNLIYVIYNLQRLVLIIKNITKI